MAKINFRTVQKKGLDAFVDGTSLALLQTQPNSSQETDRNLYAVVDDGAAFKVSDTTYGGRLNTIAANNGATDPVKVTAHGLTGNNSLGDLTNAISFTADGGFGVDNAPESGGRWINWGDSVTLEVQGVEGQAQALKSVSFVVDTAGGSSTVLLDADGAVVRDFDLATNNQLVGNFGTRWGNDFAQAVTAADGSTVTLDFEAKTVTVDGATVAMNAALYAAFVANGIDQLTVGAGGGSGANGGSFSVKGLELSTVDTFAAADARGTLSLNFEAVNQNSSFLTATFDPEAAGDALREVLATKGSGISFDDVGPGGGENPITGSDAPDLLDVIAFGPFDGRIGVPDRAGAPPNPGDPDFQYQVAGLRGNERQLTRLGVDPGSPAANPDDGTSLGGNFGDESNGALTNGEFLRFDLGSGYEGFSLDLNLVGIDAGVLGGDPDARVLLYSDGVLIETVNLDFTQAPNQTFDDLGDNLGQTFNRIDVQSIGGNAFFVGEFDVLIA